MRSNWVGLEMIIFFDPKTIYFMTNIVYCLRNTIKLR
jgi:hypothetical protein